jgi:ABC-2 type transport system ATP-binding protein
MAAAITTEGLTKRFGTHLAVDQLDLEVSHGQVFGFLGPNGAGKTTTIGMLLGLVRPTAGRAVVLGCDVAREPERALSAVGAMIEAPAFYPYLSGRDNLRVLARAAGLPVQRVEATLAAVALGARARDRIRSYSQGMKQRLAIAAALLPDPRLILLDEPTNGLDPAGQIEIRELIRELAAGGHTIFLTSHMLHEVEQLCERVAILKQGRLVVQGTVAQLLRRGRGVRMRLVGEAAAAAERLRAIPWVDSVEQNEDVLVVGAPVERAAELNILLVEEGFGVAELGAVERHLEDFFLEVTGVYA